MIEKKLFNFLLMIILLITYLLVGNHFHFLLSCPIKTITGFYCPGCGITRMLLSLLKLDFYQAFRFNPLLFICLPFFGMYYLYDLYNTYKNREPKFKKFEPIIWYSLITIFLVYGILRNIPMFDFLAPTLLSK